MKRTTYPDLLLAVYPTTRGFAYVMFDGPISPFDWAMKDMPPKGKNAATLTAIEKLIERYHPDVLVMEKLKPSGQNRSIRICDLYKAILHLAETHQIEVFRYDRSDVQRWFASVCAKTKPEIAQAIAREIPAFIHRLPPIRKIWMSADRRQSLFDASALALCYFNDASLGSTSSSIDGPFI